MIVVFNGSDLNKNKSLILITITDESDKLALHVSSSESEDTAPSMSSMIQSMLSNRKFILVTIYCFFHYYK